MRLFFIFLIISLVNIISTTHMIPIMLIGINFYLFTKLLDEKKYYGVLASIFVFIIFEINHGFPLMSIPLLAYILHILIIPYFMTNLSILNRSKLMSISVFYLALYIFLFIAYDVNSLLSVQLLLNLLLDLIVGFILL